MTVIRLPAKLARPRLYGAVERERLFALLDSHRERPLTWVVGPPGAGKTTLIASYAARRKLPTLWDRLDHGDADPATFFNYLVQGARAVVRKKKLSLPLLTVEYMPDLPGFSQRFFRMLFAALPAGAVLVLDNYESAAASILDRMLALAVEEVPPGMRMIVTSREPPGVGLAHLGTKGSLALISWEALRLTGQEAQAIAATTSPAAAVEVLHSRCDGWVAGFVLLLENARQGTVAGFHGPVEIRESLFAYFLNELFAQAEPSLRNLLQRTALMPAFTATQAQAMCPEADAATFLDALCRRHYFIQCSAGSEAVYRYHALFRDFLLAQGQTHFRGDERRRLLRQAAELLEDANCTEDAIALYTEAQAWPQAAALICRMAATFLGSGRNATLVQAISALPPFLLDDLPWLAYWLGTARVVFDQAAGRALIERAYAGFDRAGDSTGTVLASAGVLESYFFEWSDLRPVAHWLGVFEAQLKRQGPFPSEVIEVRVLSAVSSLVLVSNRMRRELLDRLLKRAFELAIKVEDRALCLTAASFAGLVLVSQGELEKLQVLAERVERPGSTDGVQPLYQVLWTLELSLGSHQRGEHLQQLGAIERAERLVDEFGLLAVESLVAGHGALASLNAGLPERVRRYMDRMRRRLNPARTLDACHFDHLMSLLLVAEGDPAAGARLARQTVDTTLRLGPGVLSAQSRAGLALALIDLGDFAGALAESEHVLSYAEDCGFRILSYAGRLLKADALRGLGLMDGSRAALRAALADGRALGLGAMFPWAPTRFMQRLFVLALDSDIEVDHVRKLIRKLGVPACEQAGESWPWPVRIRSLGLFEVMVGDARLEYSRKLPRRPLALLKFLIAHRGEARVEHAIDALWRDEEADAAANALDAALHRLRRLLGGTAMVELQDGRLRVDRSAIWVDVFAFEDAMEEAMAADGGGEALGRALVAYRGHFLVADADEPWSVSARERLRVRFARLAAFYGQQLQDARQHEAAAAHYTRAIDVDDQVEAFYQGLMRSQLALGHKSDGCATFARLKRILAAELGVAPAAASVQLYDELRAG